MQCSYSFSIFDTFVHTDRKSHQVVHEWTKATGFKRPAEHSSR